MNRLYRMLILSAAFCAAAPFASFAAQPQGGTVEIAIKDYAFAPAAVTVPRGTHAVWKNQDEVPHNVVATEKAFTSPALDTGEGFTWTFDKPGRFTYFCRLHPQMTGTIEVTP